MGSRHRWAAAGWAVSGAALWAAAFVSAVRPQDPSMSRAGFALAGAWTVVAGVRWMLRSERAEIRRATLLRHADPLAAQVADLAAESSAHRRQIDFITTALADVVRQDGAPAADLETTKPLLRIVSEDHGSAEAG